MWGRLHSGIWFFKLICPGIRLPFPLHSIQLLCSALQQLTDGFRMFLDLHHVCHGIAKRANGVGKARGVLSRSRGYIESEDPRRIVLAVQCNNAADHPIASHELVSAVGHIPFPPLYSLWLEHPILAADFLRPRSPTH